MGVGIDVGAPEPRLVRNELPDGSPTPAGIFDRVLPSDDAVPNQSRSLILAMVSF